MPENFFDLMTQLGSDTAPGQPGSDRIIELESLIIEARHAYYNTESPAVEDEVYDAWVDELSSLKNDSPAVTGIGATPVSEWLKAAHTIPMGSLSKINTLEELTAWVMGTGESKFAPLLVTEKLDGISIAVDYVKGAFSRAVTRGDGIQGEDISVNVARMQGVPGKLAKPFTGTLRGEVVLKKTDHAKYFPQYANPRNAASGIAKRLDGHGCEHLTIMFYHVADGQDFESEGEQFAWLSEMGLQIPNWYVTAMTPGIRTPHDLWLEYQQFKRAELDYEIDGLVIRINDIATQLALGEVDNRPKGQVAFKFAPMTRESVLQRIDWQTGGSGRITPVAIFNPVRVLGAEITCASLYNVAYIKQLGLDVGATILIARAQDVIPRVAAVRKATGTVAEPPLFCPTCKGRTQMEGEYLVCTNTAECPAQAVGRIKRYVAVLGILEWGETLIEKLVALGLVNDVSDLYKLTEGKLADVDRMGPKSAAKVVKTLWARNKITMDTLLGSLSIPLCGPSTIKMAMNAGLDSLEKIKAANIEQLSAVEGLGPVKAQAIWTWLQRDSAIVDKLLLLGVEIEGKVHGTCTGKSFCFTGASSRPRAELEQLAKKAGGEVKSSVGKKLTYLVLADANSTSSKAVAARKNGTQCISEEDFIRLVTT
jgi:DNA ligase (NAD+)